MGHTVERLCAGIGAKGPIFCKYGPSGFRLADARPKFYFRGDTPQGIA